MTNETHTNAKRSILITGCSTGIGYHCAHRLVETGWKVITTARKDEDIALLQAQGLECLYLDYTDEASIEAAFAKTMEITGGTLDALFNNGAYGQPGAVEDLPTEALRKQFEANFFGWHHLTNLTIPVMRQQGRGRIVHCSSILGFVPYPWRGAYNASKFALEGLASTMRLELHETDIHISLIEPGPIESEFTKNGVAHFKEHIDMENSVHQESYKSRLSQMNDSGGPNRFRLGPEAVFKKLDHALNSQKPKAHYPVTVPTYFMAIMKRIAPQSIIDRILRDN